MAIVVAPAEDSDLMQGDVLRDVPFLAVGIDGAPEVDRKGQYVLVLSRPCKALRDDVVVVAPVVPFPLELAEIAKSGSSPAGGLERMRRLLSGLRDARDLRRCAGWTLPAAAMGPTEAALPPRPALLLLRRPRLPAFAGDRHGVRGRRSHATPPARGRCACMNATWWPSPSGGTLEIDDLEAVELEVVALDGEAIAWWACSQTGALVWVCEAADA